MRCPGCHMAFFKVTSPSFITFFLALVLRFSVVTMVLLRDQTPTHIAFFNLFKLIGNTLKKKLPALIAFSAFAASTQAADFGMTADAGTTGAGFHVVVPVASSLNARFGINGFDRSFNKTTDDASYNVKLGLRTFDALLDYYPTSTQFRMTGGLVYNGSNVTANATPGAGNRYTFNGNTYTAAQVGQVNGSIDFNKVDPYLGIGWGNAVAANKGWGFTADLGVMFQGSPSAHLNNTGCTSAAASCSQLASDIDVENASLTNQMHNYRYYPVARIGVTYKF